jgi:hypothetical protein
LAELLGESVPPFQNEAGQERLFFHLLGRAAARCRRGGLRLVLLVDGLDEDRGVVGGAHDHSIAALLPGNPPPGVRVVVAGRPDPPIPGDVLPGHPLRDPGVVRVLGRSVHAEAVRADMRADLARLRSGTALERDLLGLVTAAGGGLSGPDLAELCAEQDVPGSERVTEWDIERVLSTVAGRSFASRSPQWRPADGPVVYVLGHEEIEQEATRSYGPHRLAGYRDRLHAWADSYRAQGWPAGSPEYLLRGYYRLLLQSGDLRRAVAMATDGARHDRMLDLSGGDTAALA